MRSSLLRVGLLTPFPLIKSLNRWISRYLSNVNCLLTRRSESWVSRSEFQPSVDIISNWFLLTLQNYWNFSQISFSTCKFLHAWLTVSFCLLNSGIGINRLLSSGDIVLHFGMAGPVPIKQLTLYSNRFFASARFSRTKFGQGRENPKSRALEVNFEK